jgi:hypothetical protein
MVHDGWFIAFLDAVRHCCEAGIVCDHRNKQKVRELLLVSEHGNSSSESL